MPKRIQRRHVQSEADLDAHAIKIPRIVAVPLWWCAAFARKHWRAKAWIASVLVALYLPYVLHSHGTARDNVRCDRINYAALVAYQYGCTGQECSEDKAAYEQTVQMLMGSLTADCYPEAPWTPNRQLASWGSSYRDFVRPLKAIAPAVQVRPQEVEYAEQS